MGWGSPPPTRGKNFFKKPIDKPLKKCYYYYNKRKEREVNKNDNF